MDSTEQTQKTMTNIPTTDTVEESQKIQDAVPAVPMEKEVRPETEEKLSEKSMTTKMTATEIATVEVIQTMPTNLTEGAIHHLQTLGDNESFDPPDHRDRCIFDWRFWLKLAGNDDVATYVLRDPTVLQLLEKCKNSVKQRISGMNHFKNLYLRIHEICEIDINTAIETRVLPDGLDENLLRRQPDCISVLWNFILEMNIEDDSRIWKKVSNPLVFVWLTHFDPFFRLFAGFSLENQSFGNRARINRILYSRTAITLKPMLKILDDELLAAVRRLTDRYAVSPYQPTYHVVTGKYGEFPVIVPMRSTHSAVSTIPPVLVPMRSQTNQLNQGRNLNRYYN